MERSDEDRIDPREKLRVQGPLAMTFEDHEALGSTAPDILRQNPGKAWVELLSNEEINRFLREQGEDIKEYSIRASQGDQAAQDMLQTTQRILDASLRYLDVIDLLPPKYNL